jgi:hypothetical protein
MERRPLTEEQIIARGYVKPRMPSIGSEATALYAAEAAMADAIDGVMKELAKVLGFSPMQKWTHCAPEMLASILQSYDDKAAILAAIAYLEGQGFTVVPAITVVPDDDNAA